MTADPPARSGEAGDHRGGGPPAGTDGIAIRELSGMDELREAVRFQEEIWGEGFSERVPVSLMKVSARLGGVVAGAFADGEGQPARLVGFVYGMTGLVEGEPVHWSDILAVAPGYRDRGLGRRLKWFQRQAVMSRGIRLMFWTCDPLEARNLAVNLNHLGATAHEYVRDMYGHSDSPLHRGLGTDRFVIRWELDAPGVVARAADRAPPSEGAGQTGEWIAGLPVAFPVEVSPEGLPVPCPLQGAPSESAPPESPPPGSAALASTSHQVRPRRTGLRPDGQPVTGFRVPIPSSIQSLRDAAPELARGWRERTRDSLEPALSRGWIVDALVRGELTCDLVLRPPTPDSTP